MADGTLRYRLIGVAVKSDSKRSKGWLIGIRLTSTFQTWLLDSINQYEGNECSAYMEVYDADPN